MFMATVDYRGTCCAVVGNASILIHISKTVVKYMQQPWLLARLVDRP